MKPEQITLVGTTDYNESYPPKNAKKGYVARITGRAKGAVKYEREFLGQTADLFAGDEGLYERQRGDKKGGYTRWYHVLLSHPEHGLILSTDCEDETSKIAKLLSDGHKIEDIIEVSDLRPGVNRGNPTGRMVFDVVVRSPSQAKSVAKSATIDSAIEACWETLSLLPQPQQRKVLAALHKRISPLKSTTDDEKS